MGARRPGRLISYRKLRNGYIQHISGLKGTERKNADELLAAIGERPLVQQVALLEYNLGLNLLSNTQKKRVILSVNRGLLAE
jgi:hypothetical protein